MNEVCCPCLVVWGPMGVQFLLYLFFFSCKPCAASFFQGKSRKTLGLLAGFEFEEKWQLTNSSNDSWFCHTLPDQDGTAHSKEASRVCPAP